MKSILFAVTMICISAYSFAQSATVTSDHKLLIPADSKTQTFSISKTQFATMAGLVSKQGEIQSYSIAYTIGNSYFSKSITSNTFEAVIGNKITQLPTGTKIYFDDINIKAFTNPAVSKTTAQFVLTD